MNVSAVEKGTGKSECITISNDKGRLTKAEMDRMLSDAEKYKKEDDLQREKIQAKNSLESYVFGVKQAAEESGDKISQDEKNTVVDKCHDILKWTENNLLAEKEEYEFQRTELERVSKPIMMKIHGGGNRVPGGDSSSSAGKDGPTVEEVD